ncbi:MAG: hypothetical protein MI741_07135 [Rhodospirillales bacterium]|nr:hypothetical protein [Rhodospirillales bacterium]
MMVRIKDKKKFEEISSLLETFPNEVSPFVGLTGPESKFVLVAQLIDSIRRTEFLRIKSVRAKSASLYTPYSGSFEPFGGAAAMHKVGQVDDAYWLVYLASHFGKHKTDGWNLTEDFYGRFGQGGVWNWTVASKDPLAISDWLETVYPHITNAGRSRRFGNHRKFETLKPGPKGTGHAIATYIDLVNQHGSHQALIDHAQKSVGQNPKEVFAHLYRELDRVAKLGRLGKFDLLCNLSNLQVAPIVPDKAYIAESTGPKAGARLLFGNDLNTGQLEETCAKLAEHLGVSPQVIEDALCNWQKSPNEYIYFRG